MPKLPLSFQVTALAITFVLLQSVIRYFADSEAYFELYAGYWLILLGGILGAAIPRPMGKFAVLFSILSIVAFETVYFLKVGFSLGILSALLVSVAGVLVVADERLQSLFFVPKMRWWETSERYPLKANAEVLWSDHVNHMSIKNISTTGCLAQAEEPVQVNSPVQIKFNQNLVLDAVVIRTENLDVGLKFNFKNRRQQQELRNYIRETVAAQAT